MLLGALLAAALLPTWPARGLDEPAADHLVISEILTGGASASDELIEIHNPTTTALPLEGLELVYVTASGATISRRAAWEAGAPLVPPGGHLLVANEAGIHAAVADALYAGGMAATGGSVALRILGAATAVDAVGWGTAASTWREGTNVAVPAVGSSIERLPGGPLGSTQDTDDNAADFVERPAPEPQNLASPPTPDPGAPPPTPAPTPPTTASPTVIPTVSPSAEPSPSPGATSVAEARAAADGTIVTIEAIALTTSAFHDGGGFVADASGGIAVLLEEGSFERGQLVRVTGALDDRFSQRTIRAEGVELVGAGSEPAPASVATGSVVEAVEGRLVRVRGGVSGSPTALTSGTAIDLDDGSGTARVIVPLTVAHSTWTVGAIVEVIGIAGQRDSTGSGTDGYRVMLRDAADVVEVLAAASPTPGPSSTPEPTPDPSDPAGGEDVVSIAEARAAAKNARLRVRGVVTLAPGIVDPATAVIQDATGAIVLRLGDEAGSVELGQHVEVPGTRSTKGGMETLRVSEPPLLLGTAAQPPPMAVRTGDAGEAHEMHEATLVVARGALVAGARRAASGTVSFELDDGSGPLRVSLGAVLEAGDGLASGTWVEVTGILGQETTGAQPLRGYRIWPRAADEVRVVASATTGGADEDGAGERAAAGGRGPAGSLGELDGGGLADLHVGATLVAGPWPELGVAGVLWDGTRIVAIDAGSSAPVSALVGRWPPPVALDLGGLRSIGTEPVTGAGLVTLGTEPGDVVPSGQPAALPSAELPVGGQGPSWVSLVGRLAKVEGSITVGERTVPVETRCDGVDPARDGLVAVTGIAAGDPVRIIAPCGGIAPVPTIGRSGLAVAGAARPGDGKAAAPAAVDVAEPDGRRLLVAGLFVAAALMLAGAAVGRYWLSRHDIDTDAASTAETADEAEAPGDLPHLTLVRVPNEHGP